MSVLIFVDRIFLILSTFQIKWSLLLIIESDPSLDIPKTSENEKKIW